MNTQRALTLLFLLLIGALVLHSVHKHHSPTPVRPLFQDTLAKPSLSKDSLSNSVPLDSFEQCLQANNMACVCPLLPKVQFAFRNPSSWSLLNGQCALIHEDSREALKWFEQAKAQGLPHSVVDPFLQKARSLLADAENLGLVRSVHFDLQVEDKAFSDSDRLLQALESAYDSLCLIWSFYPEHKLQAVLYQSKIYQGAQALPDWAGASYDGKIRIPANIMENWPHHAPIVYHEVAHAFHRELNQGNSLPIWLDEGLAQDFDGTVVDSLWLKQHPSPAFSAFQNAFLTEDSDRAKTLYQYSLLQTRFLLKAIGRDSLKQAILQKHWPKLEESLRSF